MNLWVGILLNKKNVDYGGGLERIALATQNKKDIFETDNFYPIIKVIEKITEKSYNSSLESTKAMRVLADHMRASVIMSMDHVEPSNKDQGYILRRLIRRMARHARVFNIQEALSPQLVDTTISVLSWLYPDLENQKNRITDVIKTEEEKFHIILKKMEPVVIKRINMTNKTEESLANAAFDLYQSYGYPLEIFIEDVTQTGILINEPKLEKFYKETFYQHKQKSRVGSEKKFKGGLANNSKQVIKYHTATHLIHQSLNIVTNDSKLKQEGSNITGERLRFDFSSTKIITKNEIKLVEEMVNKIINDSLDVSYSVLPYKEAISIGAKSFFKEKYGENVKIYFIGGNKENPEKAFSKEFCGGPHVKNTSEIGVIEIYELKKIGEKKYRIYARNKF